MIGRTLSHTVLALIVFIWIVPFVALVTTSLRSETASKTSGFWTAFTPTELGHRFSTNDKGTKIKVHYEHFSSDVPEAKNTHAIKVNSNYLIKENIEITNGLSFLDPNFRSIGKLEKEKGTLAIQSGLNWSINNTENIKVNYETRRKRSSSETLVKKEQQFTTDANLQLYKISTTHGFRYEDFLSYETLDITDFKLNAYKSSATFGNKSLNINLIPF